MEIDINYSLVYYTTNVNIYEYHWKGYGLAVWYDTRLENYHQAKERIKNIVWEEIYSDHPHLKGVEVKYIESGEMPIIDINDM